MADSRPEDDAKVILEAVSRALERGDTEWLSRDAIKRCAGASRRYFRDRDLLGVTAERPQLAALRHIHRNLEQVILFVVERPAHWRNMRGARNRDPERLPDMVAERFLAIAREREGDLSELLGGTLPADESDLADALRGVDLSTRRCAEQALRVALVHLGVDRPTVNDALKQL